MGQHFIMEGRLINKFVFKLELIFREKTLEFVRSCLDTETHSIGILVSRGFEVWINEIEIYE